jgi:hypothetical protein
VLQELLQKKLTETKRDIGKFGGLAFFFEKRSCKYLKVTHSKKRRTGILRQCTTIFAKSGRLLSHLDP